MERIFRAEKFISRIKREGRTDLLDVATLSVIQSLDGAKGNDYNWASVVRGEPLTLIPKTEEHPEIYVATCDCD